MLANPIWVGVLRNTEGDHRIAEPFVPVDLWEAAQKTLRGPDGPRAGRRTQRFLLGNGLLRCGRCGSAMIVKRDRKDYGYYEAYLCGGRSSGTAPGCTQGAVQRAAVDTAVLAYFERVGLDVEATRAELVARADRERAELRGLRSQAERELVKATERLERVRRAFQDGVIEADDWADQRPELQAELQAAEQGATRLAAREAEVADDAGVLEDVELLARLTELRSAIAGDVTANHDDFAATHAALRRLSRASSGVPLPRLRLPVDTISWTPSSRSRARRSRLRACPWSATGPRRTTFGPSRARTPWSSRGRGRVPVPLGLRAETPANAKGGFNASPR